MRLIDADEILKYKYEPDGCLYEAVDIDYILEAPTVAAAPEWISVKEKLPKDDGYNGTVLATDGSIVITAPSSSVTIDGAITHWMSLPEPPKEKK